MQSKYMGVSVHHRHFVWAATEVQYLKVGQGQVALVKEFVIRRERTWEVIRRESVAK